MNKLDDTWPLNPFANLKRATDPTWEWLENSVSGRLFLLLTYPLIWLFFKWLDRGKS